MRIAMACVAGLVAASGLPAAPPAVIYHVVLKNGDPSPGLGDGVISRVYPPRINRRGDVVVHTSVRLSPTSAVHAMYGERDGVLRLIAYSGMQVPGMAEGVTLNLPSYYRDLMIDSEGNAYFAGSLSGPGVNIYEQVVIRERNGAIEVAVREGDPAPGLPGLALSDSFGNVSVNASGKMAFTTKLAGVGVTGADDDVVYVEGPEGYVPLREGWPAPGFPSLALAALRDITGISDDGMIALNVTAQGSSGSRGGTLVFSATELRFVVVTGAPSPIPGLLYGGYHYGAVLSPNGTLVLSTSLDGPGVTSSTNLITLVGSATDLRVFLRERDVVPGYPAGTLLNASGGVAIQPLLNGRGELVAKLDVQEPPLYMHEDVVFTNIGGPLRPLGLPGAAVPHIGEGLTLAGNSWVHRVLDGDRMVVRAGLSGPGVTNDNNECVILRDADGEMYSLLRKGQEIDLDPQGDGDIRVVESMSGGFEWSLPIFGSYSDGGAIAFLVSFGVGMDAVLVATPLFDCPACAADFDSSGGVDGGDIAEFFATYEAGGACADVDHNGGVDGADLGAFFQVFEAGGC